jgi:hypothetical protein
MSRTVDANLQAKLLAEAEELYEKRARLEASLRAADALCNQRIETAALREINNYRTRHLAAHKAGDDKPEMPATAPVPNDKSRRETGEGS